MSGTLIRWLSVLLVTYAALHGLWTVFHWGGEAVVKSLAGLLVLPPSLAATVTAIWRAQQEWDRTQRRAWIILATACTMYSVATVIWGYYTVVYQRIPFPTLADALYVAFPLVVFAALAHLSASQLSRVNRTRVILNTLMVVFALGLIEWSFVLRIPVEKAGDVLTALTALLYPLGDLVMLGGVAFTLQHSWGAERRGMLRPVLLGVGFLLLGDLVYAVQIASGTYVPATLLDVTWTVGMVCFTLAALQPKEAGHAQEMAAPRNTSTTGAAVLILTVGAYAALIPLLLANPRFLDAIIAFVALSAVGVLTYLRQLLDARENEALSLKLQESNDSLEQRVDEATSQLAVRNDELSDHTVTLTRQKSEARTMSDLTDLLQACMTFDEARGVLERAAPILFAGLSGSVAVINSSRNLLESVVQWGEPALEAPGHAFDPQACWSLRRGHPHQLSAVEGRIDMPCQPLRDSCTSPCTYLCLPLVAQGETLGVLRLASPGQPGTSTEQFRELAQTAARQLALALANLKLRDALRLQSIRDPLTGLFNRRYLEETLERELQRVTRTLEPLSLLMFDADHFKRFNDTFGHDAGDAVLQEIGLQMRQFFREDDVVCRFGGEEFVVVMIGMSPEQAQDRAEAWRQTVEQLSLRFSGRPLGSLTISVGVATVPGNAQDSKELLRAADQALYRAKHAGRNRVVSAALMD
ncbi:sensor domain-containing diguanylate cyclase [Deinococcus sp.]|uniref:GGDEF domain-containing protein n=1 Tax=Deinococcus sp. TaxID=47478 RepID=UPI002869B4A1|nr:sensor domain-containing diguanylate cyclase [Deinococcus sp.]